MKIVRVERLIDAGGVSDTQHWRIVRRQVENAIHAIEWPPGSGSFTLYEQSGKKRGEGNGVAPIKEAFVKRLESYGWSKEACMPFSELAGPGPMDAACTLEDHLFCAEWETGNISSSHRAINKMALGILRGVLLGGVLILPTRAMYRYLTDRIGNFPELEPYFPVWRALRPTEGILEVIAIEHDAVSKEVPRIEKRTDGRALF